LLHWIPKRLTTIICMLALLGTANNGPVGATVTGSASDFIIKINNEQVAITPGEQQPVIIKDRTYVPLRVITENMGAQVNWNEDSRQVIIQRKQQTSPVLPVAQSEDVQIIIDGQIMTIPANLGKAYISNLGRTMIPLRAVGEALDCEVNWFNESRTVDIKFSPAPVVIPEVPTPVEEPPTAEATASPEDEVLNLQLLKDLAVYRTNLKLMDGTVMNSAELLTKQPADFSAAQLSVFKTYWAQLSQYQSSIMLPDGTVVNSADISILGDSYLTADQLRKWIQNETPRLIAKANANGLEFKPIPDLAELYIRIGAEYGIRGDIAFCQAAKETGYWQFTGSVQPGQYNYCGLWATGSPLTGQESLNGADPERVRFEAGLHGATFVTPAAGVEAHIQHLFAYATKSPLPVGKLLVDPRYVLVNRGTAPSWLQLNARWAVPGTTYGQSILADYWFIASNCK
jgi:hypothetical protein